MTAAKKAAPKKAAPKKAPAKPSLEGRLLVLEVEVGVLKLAIHKIIQLGPSVHKSDKYWKKILINATSTLISCWQI